MTGKAKTVWGYEAVAIFGGKPGGLVRPALGALWVSREAIYQSPRSQAGYMRVKRVRAVVQADGSLTYA